MIVNGFDGFEHSIRFRYLNSYSQYLIRTHQLIASYSTRIHRMYSTIWAFFLQHFVCFLRLWYYFCQNVFVFHFVSLRFLQIPRKWYKISNLTWYRWYSLKIPHSKCYKFINKVNLLFLAKSFSRFILWNIAFFLHLVKYHIDSVSPQTFQNRKRISWKWQSNSWQTIIRFCRHIHILFCSFKNSWNDIFQ